MKRKGFYLLVVSIALAVLSVIFFNTQQASAEGCVTSQCHSKMLKGKNIHPVAASCDSCHQTETTPHPQKGKQTFKLVQEGAQLCSMCHAPFGTKQNVHAPVKDGMCTTCHNPHGSDETKLLAQPLKDLCLMCHSDKVSYKNVHGPTSTGDCASCHNPHESNNKALALKNGAELCFTCHLDVQEELKKKNVHPAVMSGCTSCHNPHGAAAGKLLSDEGEKLCFQCHPKISENMGKAKVVHAPIKTEKACASCHSPHASEGEKLLPKTGKDFCLGCHKTLLKKTQTVLHGPIKDGKCIPCHDPHGTPNERLLIAEYSTDVYIPYTDNEYKLCFTCHNRDLLRYPDTSFATGFRDGDKNLHYLHINKKDKGRNCKTCHIIHGSEFPKLIADKVPFGKWGLPLGFVKTDTGGSCLPGCHKKQNYDRKTPGKEPEPAKPQEKEKEKGVNYKEFSLTRK